MNNNTTPMMSADFDNSRINFEGFVNLEKGISFQDFSEKYVKSGDFEIYTEKQVSDFYKLNMSDLEKGISGTESLKFMNNQLRNLKVLKVQNFGSDGLDGYNTIFVKEKQISKALDNENDDNLEKGQVTDSFSSYGQNKLSFTKTGKEIKAQITTVLLPVLNAQKTQLSTDLIECLKCCGDCTPKVPLSSYHYRGFSQVLPEMMTYSYNETEQPWDSINNSRQEPTEEQIYRRTYNDLVSKIVSTSADIEYCSMLSRNLKDDTKIELTADQVLGLQF